ncbi:MAG: NADH-quinone oxidoreductase subunit C [Euzebyales bacterium]|nr:NADH-quinone oxidoreductase subunit C [Euzebyales bacterium]
MSRDDNPNATLGEQGDVIEAGLDVQLSRELAALRDHLVAAYPELEVLGFRGELTLIAAPERVVELLRFCRDDETVRCELLADLSGVHWPGGTIEASAQETTGWPTYAEEREGRIEIDYLLRSVAHGHAFRVRTSVGDDAPRLATATAVYAAADLMEREVYDFFGVAFDGHPDLTRVLMPDDWDGHPHRKDYPLGGVEVDFKGATIPPPDERSY